MAGLFCSAVFAALPMTASADNSGNYGADIVWAYSESDKTLTFSVKEGLESAKIPDYDDPLIEDGYIFYSAYSEVVENVVIGKGVTRIGNRALYSFKKVTSVTIPDTVEEIGSSAFDLCAGLTALDLPDSVKNIEADAFSYCTNLKEMGFSAGLTDIGKKAFYSCESLETVDLSGTKLSKIGDNAFESCKKLKTLILPATLTGIAAGTEDFEGDAFWDCGSLAEIYCYANPSNLTWKDKDCNDFAGAANSYTTVCYVPYVYLDTYSTNFSAVNVTFKALEKGSELYGYTLSLEGDIGVNFYMSLSDILLNSDTAYMEFTIPNGTKTETYKLLVSEVKSNDSNKTDIGGKTYYKFKCRVSAKDMASTITAQMMLNENANDGDPYSYSVKEYADYLIAHAKEDGTDIQKKYYKASNLVKAMLNYGASAQTYFGISGTLANEGLSDAEKTVNVEATDLEGFSYASYASSGTVIETGVTFEGSTLSLKSQTTLSLYFTSIPTDTEFHCDGYTVETVNSGSYVIARIRGINAKDIGKSFTVTFGNNNKVTYNPFTYCYNVLNDDTNVTALQNVCKALYLYAEEASKYFGGNN